MAMVWKHLVRAVMLAAIVTPLLAQSSIHRKTIKEELEHAIRWYGTWKRTPDNYRVGNVAKVLVWQTDLRVYCFAEDIALSVSFYVLDGGRVRIDQYLGWMVGENNRAALNRFKAMVSWADSVQAKSDRFSMCWFSVKCP